MVAEAVLTPLGYAACSAHIKELVVGEAELNTTPCGDLCGLGGRVALRSKGCKNINYTHS